jgi:hypothetical protein
MAHLLIWPKCGDNRHPGLWFIRIDKILILIRYIFFSGSSSKKNSRLSVLGLEQYEDR